MAKGEFSFKQVGPTLLEETYGSGDDKIVVRLIAEYDPTAQEPLSTFRYRFGRVFGSKPREYLKATSVAIFTADNADAMLTAWPGVLRKIATLKSQLPVRAKATITRSKTEDDLEAELAKRLLGEAQPTIQTAVGAMPVAPQYAQPAPAQPAPAQPGNGRKAKRPY